MSDELDENREAPLEPRTGIHNAVPSFVGEAPSRIPGAPDPINTMLDEIRKERTEMMDLLRQAATDSKQGRDDIKRVLANQDMQKAALERFRDENRIRMFSYEQELVEARTEVKDLREEVSVLRGQLADVESQVMVNTGELRDLRGDG